MPSAQQFHGLGGKVQHGIREHTEVEHAHNAAKHGNTHRPGKLDGREVRCVVGPVNGAHNAEVVVERDHDAGEGGEGEAILARMQGTLLNDGL